MSHYNAPLTDARFVLEQLVNFDALSEQMGLEEVNMDLANAILEEADKLASGVLAPLNLEGDKNGAKLGANGVEQTPGFSEAYQQFAENGWGSLSAPEEFGGQNLPNVLSVAVNEFWHSANMAFALCPMLTQGSIESLLAHGSDALKEQYLPQLISGEWTGTMNLTEPNAGSDLAAVATKAVPNGDHYLITGQKIFITWGDHQMTPNIVHLVLARLPDAPAGVKGISLFIVPKFLLDENGQPGELNDAKAIALEHKLGIHGSPTCVMSFGDNGGAIGYLVGEPHQGLSCMFTMMNHARQSVGLQGLSISERALQQSILYARDRIQGTRKDGSKIAIIDFPDVRRMLMAQKSGVEAMRALAYVAGAAIDQGHHGDTDAQTRVELLTPIVKGWLTELSQELTSLNIQVHGGMGYVEETGAAQHYRDARILPIYEGTTGIQALDLIGRKTLSNNGEAVKALLAEMADTLAQLDTLDEPALKAGLASALEAANAAVESVLTECGTNRDRMGAVAVDYLMMMGYLCGGWLMAKSALQASALTEESSYAPEWIASKLVSARFFANHYLPRVQQHSATLQTGLGELFSMDQQQMFGEL